MDVDPAEWRRHQRYLLAVAYRLLGSLTEAEDAVQEAYLRLAGAEATDVGGPAGSPTSGRGCPSRWSATRWPPTRRNPTRPSGSRWPSRCTWRC